MKIEVIFKQKNNPTKIHNINNKKNQIQIINFLNKLYGKENWLAFKILNNNERNIVLDRNILSFKKIIIGQEMTIKWHSFPKLTFLSSASKN